MAESLPAYTQADALCCKCGCLVIGTAYQMERRWCDPQGRPTLEPWDADEFDEAYRLGSSLRKFEWLVRTCERCGYTWREATYFSGEEDPTAQVKEAS